MGSGPSKVYPGSCILALGYTSWGTGAAAAPVANSVKIVPQYESYYTNPQKDTNIVNVSLQLWRQMKNKNGL